MAAAIAGRVKAVSAKLDLTREELARLVGASPRAVSRWSSGETAPQHAAKQRLLELGYISDQLAKVLDPDDANIWMFSPNEFLRGDTPASHIKDGDFATVRGLIEALAEGFVV